MSPHPSQDGNQEIAVVSTFRPFGAQPGGNYPWVLELVVPTTNLRVAKRCRAERMDGRRAV
jgi:hypothetical protein